MLHDITKDKVRKRALEGECPACGARAGVRCRTVTRYTGSTRVKVDVKREPCPERATRAWRELLDEEDD